MSGESSKMLSLFDRLADRRELNRHARAIDLYERRDVAAELRSQAELDGYHRALDDLADMTNATAEASAIIGDRAAQLWNEHGAAHSAIARAAGRGWQQIDQLHRRAGTRRVRRP